jgi:AbrB family looped-hinge helix DNA binding protein
MVLGLAVSSLRDLAECGATVIPKELRDQLGIKPGDEVSFWMGGRLSRDGLGNRDHVSLILGLSRCPCFGPKRWNAA